MDVRYMDLAQDKIKNVSSISTDSYNFDEDRRHRLTNIIEEMIHLDFWNPRYQAYWPLINTYLGYSLDIDMKKKYYTTLQLKKDELSIPDNKMSSFFADILDLNKTKDRVLFADIDYSTIEKFCVEVAQFFMVQRKTIKNRLYNEDMYNSIISDLVEPVGDGEVNWYNFVRAIELYRHCQINNMRWSAKLINTLQLYAEMWDNIFKENFREIQEFLEDKVKVYGWYCNIVLNVMESLFTDAAQLKNNHKLTANSVYSLPANIATKLVIYVNDSPAVYDCPYTQQQVWDSVFPIFFNEYASDDFLDTASYKALCVPKDYFDKMCDTLFDFYWIIKDKKLTERLFVKFLVKNDENANNVQSQQDFLNELYMRGFPEYKK